jgi:hypothetical protein
MNSIRRSMSPERYEFAFPHLDTLVQVEKHLGTVLVRATRDTFSSARKEYFIRELAAEGFIPDEFQWFQLSTSFPTQRGVRWIIDFSWLKPSPEIAASTGRFMRRLLFGAGIFWVGLMLLVICHGL